MSSCVVNKSVHFHVLFLGPKNSKTQIIASKSMLLEELSCLRKAWCGRKWLCHMSQKWKAGERMRGRKLCLLGAFYVLIMWTPCSTLCSAVGRPSVVTARERETAEKRAAWIRCTPAWKKKLQKNEHPHFPRPDSSFLGFPSQQRGKRVDRASWRRAPSL